MTGWLEGLPAGWLILVVFAATSVVTAGIYVVAMRVAVRPSGRELKGLSPGLLSPMGLVFGLIVGFMVAGLWADLGDARDAVNREASALRSVELVVGAAFPGDTTTRIDSLIDRHIHIAATQEWPAMKDQKASLKAISVPLAEALRVAVTLDPKNQGQVTAQRELVSSLQNALDARRQRIIVSESTVNWVRWTAIVALAALTLVAIAFVHSENPRTTRLAMGIFGAAVAVTLVLIASQARPFSGEFGVTPDALLQVAPQSSP